VTPYPPFTKLSRLRLRRLKLNYIDKGEPSYIAVCFEYMFNVDD